MTKRNRIISPTEIETREDALEDGDTLSEYATLDRGLKSISSALRVTIAVGIVTVLAFLVLAVAYVRHEGSQERQATQERNDLLIGVCDTVSDITRVQISALLAAAAVDGTPATEEQIRAFVDPIEEALGQCVKQIPPIE